MFDLFPTPTVYAHRGASCLAPENTLAAFELAARQGADAIELDAQLCGDAQVVVIHDLTVNRTTNGIGKVRDLQLAALKQLDAGAYFDNAFQGERIPTLSEVFEVVGNRLLINIELKNDASIWDDLPKYVAGLVIHHNMQQRVVFSSFNPIALLKVKRLLPNIPCGLLAFSGVKGAWQCAWGYNILGCEALHPEVSSVNSQLVKQVHKNGKRINVYTPDTAEDIENLLNLGVDGIITDDPPLAIQLVKEHHQSKSNTIDQVISDKA